MAIFVIAEIGINHNGSVKFCKQLIDLAKDTGCDAVKFQKRDIDLVYSKEILDQKRDSPWGTTQREQKMGLELDLNEYKEIDSYCKEKEIPWFASAWDLNSQNFLRRFDCGYNKIASAMIVYAPLLQMVAEEKKHTFISTGMSTYSDIDRAVEIFSKENCPFELMHTVSTYPMKNSDANLAMIEKLKDRYGCTVGYSGHEVGLAISYGAAALGISSLERHITLSRAMYGSDQAASLEPMGLRQLVGAVRKIEQGIGNGEKTISEDEARVAEKLRAHLY
jgi:N-acetylneuraminate synthase